MIKGNVLEYKGYHTKVEFDSEDMILRGKIEGINDLVNFECENIKEVEKEFHEAVDEYLEFCKEVGKEPEKEYKGIFQVRINPDLHKKLAIMSRKNGDTLNASVEKAIQEYISRKNKTERNLENSIKILSAALKTESTYLYRKNAVYWNDNMRVMYGDQKMKYYGEMIRQ